MTTLPIQGERGEFLLDHLPDIHVHWVREFLTTNRSMSTNEQSAMHDRARRTNRELVHDSCDMV